MNGTAVSELLVKTQNENDAGHKCLYFTFKCSSSSSILKYTNKNSCD